jgi:aconitase A
MPLIKTNSVKINLTYDAVPAVARAYIKPGSFYYCYLAITNYSEGSSREHAAMNSFFRCQKPFE